MKMNWITSRKHLTTLLIGLVVILSLLVGCNNSSTTESPSSGSETAATSSTASTASTTTSTEQAKAVELKYVSLLSGPNNAGADFQMELCEDVENLTNGAVKIKIYWAKELCEPKDVPEMVRQGTIDIGAFPPGDFPHLLPINEQLQGYATLTNNPEVAHYYWWGLTEQVPELLQEWNDANMQFLARQWVSTKYLITQKPLQTLDDCKGLQFRVPGGQYLADVCSGLGATRVMIPLADVYESFMRNAKDGTLISTDLIYTQKFYEIGKYVCLPFGCEPFWCQAINLDVWNSFTPEIQEAFAQASKNFDEKALNAALGMDATYIPLLEEEGVEFVEFNQQDWQTALETAGDQMTYFQNTMEERGMSEVASRMAPIWKQLVEEGHEKYGTK